MFDQLMAWKFSVGRLFGIAIRVHILFPLVLVPFTLGICIDQNAPEGTWKDAVTAAAIITLSILIHEFGHCFAARLMGGEADEVLLWPLGGLAQVSYLPSTPSAHFVFAAGGPLANIAICILSGLMLTFGFDQSIRPQFNLIWYPFRESGYTVTQWNGETYQTTFAVMLVVWTFYLNWLLTVFNLVLVGLPWDSGAMGRAILWRYVGYAQATMYMIVCGFIVAAILFMGAFIWYNVPFFVPLSLYTFLMCYREWLMLESRGEEGVFGYDFSQGYTSLEKDAPAPTPRKKQNFIQRFLQRRAAKKMQRETERQEAEELRMDELLAKIQRHGKESLTEEETRFLKRVSDRYRNRH